MLICSQLIDLQANPIACAAALESARLLEGCYVSTDLADGELPQQGNTWFEPEAFGGRGGMKPSFLESDIRDVSLLPGVKGVMSLGSVLSVELKPHSTVQSTYNPGAAQDGDALSGNGGSASSLPRNSRYYNSNASAVVVSLLKQNNVYARPLGNVVYLMPTPLTPEMDRQRLIRVIKRLSLIMHLSFPL